VLKERLLVFIIFVGSTEGKIPNMNLLETSINQHQDMKSLLRISVGKFYDIAT
jgi:hypothetical protein